MTATWPTQTFRMIFSFVSVGLRVLCGKSTNGDALLRQDQLALPRPGQTINLPVAFDPDFVATTSKLVKLDDLGHF